MKSVCEEARVELSLPQIPASKNQCIRQIVAPSLADISTSNIPWESTFPDFFLKLVIQPASKLMWLLVPYFGAFVEKGGDFA